MRLPRNSCQTLLVATLTHPISITLIDPFLAYSLTTIHLKISHYESISAFSTSVRKADFSHVQSILCRSLFVLVRATYIVQLGLRGCQFGDEDNSSNDSNDDLDSLPYPKPLKRSDFLVPDFSAPEYLSTLQNRHQTLEDLRTELRTRSQDLNKELLDLVNNNYQDFLSLGSSLTGGDEKVEEVRLGLLGFRREVEGLKKKVSGRREEVESLVKERKAIRARIQTGRQLLELDRRITDLEQQLLLTSKISNDTLKDGEDSSEGESGIDSEDDEDDEDHGVPVRKLRGRVEAFMLIKQLSEKLGTDQLFVVRQDDRVLRLRKTILLDLKSALRQAATLGGTQGKARLSMLEIYRTMGEPNEAIRVLKETELRGN